MALIAIAALLSLAQRFGIIGYRNQFVGAHERDASFWGRQFFKVVIIVFAMWEIVSILPKVI